MGIQDDGEIDLDNEDDRTALEFAMEPLEAMSNDNRVTPVEQSACRASISAIRSLLEGRRG